MIKRLVLSFLLMISVMLSSITTTWANATSITPSSTIPAEALKEAVSKRIKNVGIVLAVSLALDELLDAVDYVMDPANNSIQYKPKPRNPTGSTFDSEVNPDNYVYPVNGVIYADPAKACVKHIWDTYNRPDFMYYGYKVTKIGVSCLFTGLSSNTVSSIGWFRIYPKEEKYSISIESVANKIIADAQAGKKDAIAFVNAVVNDLNNKNTLLSKGGKQNKQNEYVRKIQNKENDNEDPCNYLKRLKNNTKDTGEKQKIQIALKLYNCDGKNRNNKFKK